MGGGRGITVALKLRLRVSDGLAPAALQPALSHTRPNSTKLDHILFEPGETTARAAVLRNSLCRASPHSALHCSRHTARRVRQGGAAGVEIEDGRAPLPLCYVWVQSTSRVYILQYLHARIYI